MFSKPTLATVIDRIETDIQSRVEGSYAKVPRSFYWVLARVVAGAVWLLYGYLEWVTKQLFPATSYGEGLDDIGDVWGVARQKATAASGTLTITGTPAAVVPAGASLSDGLGNAYTLDAAFTVPGTGSGSAAATASFTGSAGNLESGATLYFDAPVSGVDAEATALSWVGGTDDEDDDTYRDRLLQRIRNVPHGGAASDYETWALECPDVAVERVWVSSRELGPGTVTVRFTRPYMLHYVSIFPVSAEVEALQAYLDERRPVTAEVFATAPGKDAITVNVTFHGGTAQHIQVACEHFFATLEPGSTFYPSQLSEAISATEDEVWHTLNAPTSAVVLAPGCLPDPTFVLTEV